MALVVTARDQRRTRRICACFQQAQQFDCAAIRETHRARVSAAGRHQRRDHQPTHPPQGAGGDEHSATTRTPGASVESHWVFWRLWCAPGFARVKTAKLATSPRPGEAIVAPRLASQYTTAGQRLFAAEGVPRNSPFQFVPFSAGWSLKSQLSRYIRPLLGPLEVPANCP